MTAQEIRDNWGSMENRERDCLIGVLSGVNKCSIAFGDAGPVCSYHLNLPCFTTSMDACEPLQEEIETWSTPRQAYFTQIVYELALAKKGMHNVTSSSYAFLYMRAIDFCYAYAITKTREQLPA